MKDSGTRLWRLRHLNFSGVTVSPIRRAASLFFLFVAMALPGCGPRDRHYVTGTVRYSDGTPIPEGRLIIEYGPEEPLQASATIQPDGSFRVGEIKDGDGMQAGTVRVGVVAIHYEYGEGGTFKEVPLCDERYLLPETSGLVFQVPEQLRWDIVVEMTTGTAKGPD